MPVQELGGGVHDQVEQSIPWLDPAEDGDQPARTDEIGNGRMAERRDGGGIGHQRIVAVDRGIG